VLGLWRDDDDDVAREVYEEVSGESFDREDDGREDRWRLGTDLGWRRSVGGWGTNGAADRGTDASERSNGDAGTGTGTGTGPRDGADANASARTGADAAAGAAEAGDGDAGDDDGDGWPWEGAFWREGSVDDHWRERTGFDADPDPDPDRDRGRGRRGRAWTRGRSTLGEVESGAGDGALAEARRVLDVEPGADEAAVRRAYRERVKEVHPDTDGGSVAAFIRVREAYERLRARYADGDADEDEKEGERRADEAAAEGDEAAAEEGGAAGSDGDDEE
jgi:hypothetical protein